MHMVEGLSINSPRPKRIGATSAVVLSQKDCKPGSHAAFRFSVGSVVGPVRSTRMSLYGVHMCASQLAACLFDVRMFGLFIYLAVAQMQSVAVYVKACEV